MERTLVFSAMILTGGQGTRLRPLTLYTPKPLLPIANTPFLNLFFSYLRKHSIHNAILCTSDSIAPYKELIKWEHQHKTKVICSREGRPLGTAGALKNAEKLTDNSETIFIFNGDVLTNIDLAKMLRFHRERKSKLTIALISVANPSSYGLIDSDPSGLIKKFTEKPKHLKIGKGKTFWINAGIYIFEKEIFRLIPKGKIYSSERELFPSCLLKKIPLYGFKASASSYWLDIGTPEQYLQGNRELASPSNRIGKKTKVGRNVQIASDVVIGKNCSIGDNSSLKNCVLLNNVRLGKQVNLQNCIIGSHVKIDDSTQILNSKIVGNYSHLTPFTQI